MYNATTAKWKKGVNTIPVHTGDMREFYGKKFIAFQNRMNSISDFYNTNYISQGRPHFNI